MSGQHLHIKEDKLPKNTLPTDDWMLVVAVNISSTIYSFAMETESRITKLLKKMSRQPEGISIFERHK